MLQQILIYLIRVYQIGISPLMGNHCRFYPTCSGYALIAIRTHGVFKGSWLVMKRIARCRPGCAAGVDLVPEVKK